jgi:hypothetical protein
MATTAPPTPQALTTPPVTPDTTAAPLATTPSNAEVASADQTATTTTKPVDSNPYGTSPIKAHPWDNTKSLKYQPVTILFLTGDYKGQTLDLGYNTPTVKEDQPFGWQVLRTRGVRSGIEFQSVSPRTLDITVEFSTHLEGDVRHLVENLAHLGEITGKEKTPPLLEIKIGHAVINPWVCTKFSPEYSQPFPGGVGYKKGVASLSFILQGGANTKHATGKPLGATPLSDYSKSKSETDKAKEGEIAVVKRLLAPCLGSEGSDAITSLVENNQAKDPTAIAALPPRTLVNLAISGLPPEVLADPAVAAKLSQSVAQLLAETEQGGNPSQFAAMAQSLQTGKPEGISGNILTPDSSGTTQFSRMVSDYNAIVDSIKNQTLGADSPLFDRDTNPTAGNRINNFGSCGLTLRQTGGITGGAPNDSVAPPAALTEDKAKLDNLNGFFQENPSEESFLVRFELPPDTDKEFVKCMIGGQPFEKRRNFEDEVLRCGGGQINGGSMWNRFN